MDKYLISILKEVNTIIIPGIGALTIVNQETGEVMFMSYMKFDDEKLAQHIAEKEGWELNDAKNLVSKYVRDINTKLDQGDSYDIYQFGSFNKGTDGEIEFTPWDGLSNSSSDTVVVEENTNEHTENETQEDQPDPIQEKLEDIQVEAEATIVDLKEEVEEIKSEEEDHSIDAVIDLVEEVVVPEEEEKEIIEEKIETPIAPISEEEQWKDDLDVPPINLKKEVKKKPILEKTQKDKKKKKRGVGFYLLLTLLLLLVGGGTFFAIHYDDLKEHIPFLASKSQEEVDEPIDEEEELNEPADNSDEEDEEEKPEELESVEEEEEVIPEESEVIEEIVPEPIIVNSANGLSINQSLPVQIIVGSFTEESNAERKVAQLKATGVNAEIIGRYDGLHLVSIASFNTMSEVKSSTETIKSTAGTYWIFKK